MWKSLGQCCAVACFVLATGCGAERNADQTNQTHQTSHTNQDAARLDEHHILGDPVAVENLTVWPVLTDAPLEIGEFLTLQDAQDKDLAVVRELGGDHAMTQQLATIPETTRRSETQGANTRARGATRSGEQLMRLQLSARGGATVGALEIENSSDLPILVCAGTVLKGGNQDRQIAQDFVVPAKSRVAVDAFCVERGRWTGLRHGKPTGGQFFMARAMAPSAVRAMGQYEKDQARVWEEVAHAVQIRTAVPMGTSLALSIDDADATARKNDERLAKPVRAHFSDLRESGRALVGFAYAVDGKPVTVRTFAHARILDDHLDAFIETMCMEADMAQRRAARESEDAADTFKSASAEDVVRMVRALDAYHEEVQETSAANSNGYRKGDVGFQSSCYVNQGAEQIALTKDWTAR